MYNLIELPYCKVLMLERWNAQSGRYFIAYRALNNFSSALGLPVIDEFATFSSPIFFCPTPLLGKIYNAGISLGHHRDPEMGIDLGWPPLVVGYDASFDLPANWEDHLLSTIKNAQVQRSRGAGEYQLKKLRIETTEIFITDAPLLPKQLKRLAQTSDAPLSISISIGNRLSSQKNAAPLSIKTASEAILGQIMAMGSN
jgi:hypothetical protein